MQVPEDSWLRNVTPVQPFVVSQVEMQVEKASIEEILDVLSVGPDRPRSQSKR